MKILMTDLLDTASVKQRLRSRENETRSEAHTLLSDKLDWEKNRPDPFGSFLTSALVMSEKAGRFHAFTFAHNKHLRGVWSEKGNRTSDLRQAGKQEIKRLVN